MQLKPTRKLISQYSNKEVNKPITQKGVRCSNGYKMCSFQVTIVLPPPPNVFSCLLIG